MRGLYVHIPFCHLICSYCDFVKKQVKDKAEEDGYIKSLIEELNSVYLDNPYFDTIFVGGGTPNNLSLKNINLLLKTLKKFKGVKEYTIECNPELITQAQVSLFKQYCVNRVSLGVQSFEPETIKFLKRNHTIEDVKNSVKLLKKAGIQNISFDLMYGIKNQSLEILKKDLEIAIKFKPKHISYYALILEQNTFLAFLEKQGIQTTLEEEVCLKQYNFIKKILKKHHFSQYETSNYARSKYQSQHNLIYWKDSEYIGVGLAASGYSVGMRTNNTAILHAYINKGPGKTKVKQSEHELISTAVVLGLRKTSGIKLKYFKQKYSVDLLKYFPVIKKLLARKMLRYTKGRLYIPFKYIYLENQIMQEFVWNRF